MQLDEDLDSEIKMNESLKIFGKKMIIKNLDIEYPPHFANLKNIGEIHNQEVNNLYNGKFSKSTNQKGDDILSYATLKTSIVVKNRLTYPKSKNVKVETEIKEKVNRKML